MRLVQGLRLLTLISVDGVQFLVKAAVFLIASQQAVITVLHVFWSASIIRGTLWASLLDVFLLRFIVIRINLFYYFDYYIIIQYHVYMGACYTCHHGYMELTVTSVTMCVCVCVHAASLTTKSVNLHHTKKTQVWVGIKTGLFIVYNI